MYLALHKWSHGADVRGACNVRNPTERLSPVAHFVSTSVSISGDNRAPPRLVFCEAGINSVERMWFNKALYFSFYFLFLFVLCFSFLCSHCFVVQYFSAFCNFPFLCLIHLICIYIFRSSLMFPIISLTLWRRNYSFNFSTPCI